MLPLVISQQDNRNFDTVRSDPANKEQTGSGVFVGFFG
jgi:hypothetical protein